MRRLFLFLFLASAASGQTSKNVTLSNVTIAAGVSGGGGSNLFSAMGWNDMGSPTNFGPIIPTYSGIQCVTGPAAVFTAWSGGDMDWRRNWHLIKGGGHNDFCGDEVYKMQIQSTPTTALLKDSYDNSFLPAWGGAGDPETSAIATPNSRHTYGGYLYVGQRDFYFVHGNGTSQHGFGSTNDWILDPNTVLVSGNVTNGWTLTNQAGSPPTNLVGEPHYVYVDQTPTQQPFVFTVQGGVGDAYSWNTLPTAIGGSTYTWTSLGFVNASACTNQNNITSVYVATERSMYCIGQNNIKRVNVDTLVYTDFSSASGCATPRAFQAPGADVDPIFNNITIFGGGTTVYFFDLGTHTCSSSTFSGPPTTVQTTNGTWGKFKYNWKYGIFTSCNSNTENCFYLRTHSVAAQQAQDWTNRSTASGVKAAYIPNTTPVCSSSPATTGNVFLVGGGGACPTLDTTTYTTGTASLNYLVPAMSGANGAGELWVQMAPNKYLPGSTFYWQYRIKVDAALLAQNPTATYFKQADMYGGSSSCDPQEKTGVNLNNHGQPVWYSFCGADPFEPSIPGAPGTDFLLQQGDNCLSSYGGPCTATADTGFNCHFVTGNNNSKSCFNYPAGVWMTFLSKLTFGAIGTATTNFQTWVALPGEHYQEIVNIKNYTERSGGSGQYDTAWVGPYYTSRNGSISYGSDGHFWVGDVIISDNYIPEPMAPVN